MTRFFALLALLGPLVAVSCGPLGGDGGQQANALDSSHSGWQDPLCFDCHGAGVAYEHEGSGYREPDCAACHGVNGAPVAPHPNRDACTSCHGSVGHAAAFDDPAGCQGCH